MKDQLILLLLLWFLSGCTNNSSMYPWLLGKGFTTTARGKDNCNELRTYCSGKYEEWLDEDGVTHCSCKPVGEKNYPHYQAGKKG